MSVESLVFSVECWFKQPIPNYSPLKLQVNKGYYFAGAYLQDEVDK